MRFLDFIVVARRVRSVFAVKNTDSKNMKGRALKLYPFLLLFLFCVFFFNFSSLAQSKRHISNLYGSYLKGLIYAENGEYQKALVELQRVRKADPKSVYIYLKISSLYIRLSELEEAEKVLKAAKKVDSENFDVSLALIFLYSYTQKDQELELEYEDFLKNAARKKPDDTKINEYLGQFYFYKKEYTQAVDIYKYITENDPDNIESLFWLGYLYEELGKRNDAITVWKKGLGLDSGHAPILNSLAYVYAQEGINLDEALIMVAKALEVEPKNGAYIDSLGWIYFKKGDYVRAEEYLLEANVYAKDPVIYEHLGDLYLELNNDEKALQFYTEGVEYFPDNKKLQEKVRHYGKKIKSIKK